MVDRKLTKSGQDNVTVAGGYIITLNETVIQSPDFSSLIVQVNGSCTCGRVSAILY